MNAYHICPNDDCAKILKTEKDLVKHMNFHCGNEESPFKDENDNEKKGIINRKAISGFGIPAKDLEMLKNKAEFSRDEMKWKCALCDFSADEYNWLRVFGHIGKTRKETEKFDDKEYLKEKPLKKMNQIR